MYLQNETAFKNQHAAVNTEVQKMNGTPARSPQYAYSQTPTESHTSSKQQWYPPRKRDHVCTKLMHCLLGSTEYRLEMKKHTPVGVNSVSKIDQGSRIVFPVIFVAFNVFYWLHYLDADGPASMFPSWCRPTSYIIMLTHTKEVKNLLAHTILRLGAN